MTEYYAGTLNAKNKNLWQSETECTADELKSTVRMKPLGNWVGEFDSCTGYHIVCRTTKPIKEP